MASSISLLFLVVAFWCVLYATADSERREIVESAIAQVKEEFSTLKHRKLSKAEERLRAFKASTPETRAQGLASAKFERMVNLAERKILQKQRKAKVQTKETLAEALAMEFLHRPGSVLTKEEVKLMFDESECLDTVTPPADCEGPRVRKHRLANGVCNNLENPTWGAANTEMRRLQPARYDDGWRRARGFLQSQGAFSLSKFSPPVPSPRVSSLGIIEDREVEDLTHTHIIMQWGQFMDHDLDAMPEFEIPCPDDCMISSELEGVCGSFVVPADDTEVMVTRTDPESTGCHLFHRSLPACPTEGEIRPRQQLNAITHFIDGSMVYHHDPEVQRTLIRDTSNNRGLLRTGPPSPAEPGRPLLPDAADDSEVVLCPEAARPCFLAGDKRVNEQSSLTVMHTIWVREHNRIAEIIRRNNPSITGGKVFLTAQDIVISEIQKITYQDYLPIILGPSISDLIPTYSSYDPEVRPTVANAFATAAYRYGHSQIQPFFDRLDSNYQPMEPLQLVDAFFNTTHVRTQGLDPLVRGLVQRNARKVDEFLNIILTSRLFASDANTPGLDLASLNIQRGRDHGIPSYFVWKQWAKEYCGFESEFRNQLTQIRLIQTYGSLENVDLFVGGLAEEPLPGGLVGAVFACIFADTFKSVRDGDRFYYENADTETGLYNAQQRAEFEKASLSRVLCDNTGITEIQENAFLAGQPRIPCSQIPSMDLSVFNLPTEDSNLCYARVEVDTDRNFQTVRTVSRRTRAENFFLDTNSVASGQTKCFEFQCPVDGGVSRTAIVATSIRCRHEANSGLRRSRSTRRRVYFQLLRENDISEANGIYTSAEDCAQGSSVAVSFTCGTGETTGEQHAEIESEGSVKTIEELTDELGKDIVDEISEDEEEPSSSAGTTDSKLARLMTDLLEQLNEMKTSEAHTQKTAAKDGGASDEMLVSELEKVLQRI